MVKIINPIRDKLVFQIRKEFTHFLLKILIPLLFVILFVYIIISFFDFTDTFSSFPTVVLLGIGSLFSIRVLFYTRLERYERKKLIAVSFFLLFNFVAEIVYVYEQFILGISLPYPSIADIGYLSSNLFLAYHLFSSLISLKKERNLKISYIILVSIGVSIIPIYLMYYAIYNSGIYINTYTILFLTDILYYTLDILLLVPSIIIIFHIKKNDPFRFHWLSMVLGITFLVIGDFGYTYSGQISEELLEKILIIWKIFYGISYLLLAAGIYWYGRIKRILFDKEIEIILNNAQFFYKKVVKYDNYYENEHKIEINEESNDEFEIIKITTRLLQKAERYIDILFTKNLFLSVGKIDEILNSINQKNLSKIRILEPLSKNRSISDELLLVHKNEQVLIQYFQRYVDFDAIIFLIDNEYLLIIEIKIDAKQDKNFYKATYTNNYSKVLTWSNLFERMWMSELANRIS